MDDARTFPSLDNLGHSGSSASSPPSPRPLAPSDYHHGFLSLLSQLTTVGDMDQDAFTNRLAEMTSTSTILVMQDASTQRIIACGTLLVEKKFIHSCGKAGHIEDVVVDASYRGQQLGKRIIAALTKLAQEQGCYKVILDCADANVGFYEKCGFARRGTQMARYFES